MNLEDVECDIQNSVRLGLEEKKTWISHSILGRVIHKPAGLTFPLGLRKHQNTLVLDGFCQRCSSCTVLLTAVKGFFWQCLQICKDVG